MEFEQGLIRFKKGERVVVVRSPLSYLGQQGTVKNRFPIKGCPGKWEYSLIMDCDASRQEGFEGLNIPIIFPESALAKIHIHDTRPLEIQILLAQMGYQL